MNYAYQLDPDPNGNLVTSYSSNGGAAIFNDWANLRLDFTSYLDALGNTFGLNRGALGNSFVSPNEPETTIDELILRHGPFESQPPSLQILTPLPGSTLLVGGSLTVSLTATDNGAISAVSVRFDANGDGDTDDPGETTPAGATGPNTFQATFLGVSGPAGTRTVIATAFDNFELSAEVSRDILVTVPTVAADLDLNGGILTYTARAGISNSAALSFNAGVYTLSDTAQPIVLTPVAIAAGWSGSGTNAVSGPSASVDLFAFNTGDGNDALAVSGGTDGNDRITFASGSGTNTLQINSGTARVDSTAAGGTLDTTVLANATLLTAGMRQRSLSLTGANAQAKVLPNGGATGLVVLDSLSIANGAVLDIHDNDLVLTYDPLGANPTAAIQSYINNFYNGANAGVPVIASQGIIDTGGQTVFLAIDNAQTGFGDGAVGATFYDLTLGNSTAGTGFNQTIVRYTWGGDFDLNGVVDALDYAIVDANLGQTVSPGGVAGWQRGDGDFDGMVTPLDYSAIDANLGQGGPLGTVSITPLEGAGSVIIQKTLVGKLPVPHENRIDPAWLFELAAQSNANSSRRGTAFRPAAHVARELLFAAWE